MHIELKNGYLFVSEYEIIILIFTKLAEYDNSEYTLDLSSNYIRTGLSHCFRKGYIHGKMMHPKLSAMGHQIIHYFCQNINSTDLFSFSTYVQVLRVEYLKWMISYERAALSGLIQLSALK